MRTLRDSTHLKQELLAYCRDLVASRIRSAEEAIRMAQQSANEETKSSSGDKYETGRAMAQLEIEKGSGQLAEARKLMQVLERVDAGQTSDTVRLGSLVFTSQGNYFIAIPVGKLVVPEQVRDDRSGMTVPEQVRDDGADWYALSPSSPMGAVLMGCKAGDSFVFQGKEITIAQVA